MNARLLAIAGESVLWRSVVASLQAVGVAWAASRLGRGASRGAAAWKALAPAERLRFGSAVVAWALLWLMAGQWLLPAYVGSGLPRMWFVAATVFAALLSLAAAPIARGWGDSRLARMARSIRLRG